jgi:hypothetical protein
MSHLLLFIKEKWPVFVIISLNLSFSLAREDHIRWFLLFLTTLRPLYFITLIQPKYDKK